MKLILIAGATLITAGGALGFARLAEHLASPSPHDSTISAIQTERVEPQTAITPVRLAVPQISAPDRPQSGPVADQPAAPMIRKQAVAVTPLIEKPFQNEFDNGNVMFLMPPASPSTLDAGQPSRRYDFVNMPLTGVYR